MQFGVITLPNSEKKILIYFVLLMVLTEDFMISVFHIPSFIRYINDGVVMYLFLNCLLNFYDFVTRVKQTQTSGILITLSVFLLYVVVNVLINQVPALLFLWASRNVLRFPVFFLCCSYYLERDDFERIFSFLYKFQWLNLAICLYQYLIKGYQGDYLGGIFGINKGCNISMNMFLIIISAYCVLLYIERKQSLTKTFFVLGEVILIAALAELKIIYFELALLIVLMFVLTSEYKRILYLMLISSIALFIGLLILKVVNPYHFNILTDIDMLLSYSFEKNGAYHLTRFRAFSNINNIFFKGNIIRNLFGYGFGNCEYSNYSFLTSSFYKRFGHYNYRWFSHQMFFLEIGYIGFILYCTILVSIIYCAFKQKNAYLWIRMSIIMSVLILMNLFYDSSARVEISYLTFFVLSGVTACNKGTLSVKKYENMS
ncbi:MAG: hypothetical protein MR487_04445 [Lachnospiraceae bacterium]|nr:hypothetical protein [Lachnospiraceae bacterium]